MPTSNFDKALHQAPVGIAQAAQDETPIEIEIVNPDDVLLNGQSLMPEEPEEDFNENLAEKMEDAELARLAMDLVQDVKNDLQARREWEKTYKDGVQLLGLSTEARSEPWQGACGVYHPMITEAVVRFQSDTIMETFPAAGPAKAQILGKTTQATEDAAARVTDDLNYELTTNMSEFRPEHERMLFNLPSAGSAFKKVYMDPTLGRQTSRFVPAEDVILPYGHTDMVTGPRVTHRMRKSKQEVLRMQVSGFWRDVELAEPMRSRVNDVAERKAKEAGVSAEFDDSYTIYEMLVDVDLPGFEDKDDSGEPTGLALPYVITVVEDQNVVLAIRRNWKENDEHRLRRQHFVHYVYIPGYGPYGYGLFHLIGGYAKAGTSILRQLVDAGTLSNLPGGLKAKGLRIKGDDTPIGPGEWRDVDIGSGALRDNIMPLPYKEPSQVLAGILDKLIEEARRFASTADLKAADMSNQAPVGTTLAILERMLKVMTAVQARVHFSFKQELRLLAEIVADNLEDEGYDYDVDAPLGRRARKDDYNNVAIIPVSDPNAATMSQRIVQYQAVHALSQTAPQVYDIPELHRQMLLTLGIKNVEKLIPVAKDMRPVDPVQEVQNLLAGKPVKAFPQQDHEAHIQVHTAAMQDPMMAKLMGQNPQAQAIMAAAAAHVSEHVGFAYRNRMAQTMGVQLAPYDPERPMPAQVEAELSRRMAMAAPQLLQAHKQMAAQQQAQQNAQDPVLQAQMMEQQTNAAEVKRKAQRDAADIQLAQQKLQLEAQKMQMEAQRSGTDPQQVQFDMSLKQQAQAHAQQLAEQQAQHQREMDGWRLGTDTAALQLRSKTEALAKAHQAALAQQQHELSQSTLLEKHRHELARKNEAHAAELKRKEAAHKAALTAKRNEAQTAPDKKKKGE